MTRTISFLAILWLTVQFSASPATSQLNLDAPKSIRGAHYPALSADGKQLCFEYLGDLWVAASDGGKARRLTVHRAYDAYPKWSPDGNWIAFSSNREGNFDVYIIPSRGGDARQLTFNSADDIVQDWSPDGSQILFSSARDSRYADLYTVSVKDARLHRITNDRSACRFATYSPDGKNVAFTRGRQEWWRPRYKGTANSDIYSIPAAGGKTFRYTTYPGIDAWPMFGQDGKTLYFVSDRNGFSNLYRISGSSESPEQVTFHTSDPVKFPSMARNGSKIVYEQNFEIHVLDLTSSKLGRFGDTLQITAASDLKDNVTQRITANSGAGPAAISPDSKSLAFALRGEIWTSPVEGGDATRITRTPAAEYSPTWSADGTMLAYVSDRNGNLDIFVADTKSKKETQLATDLSDDDTPQFSPDGKFLAFERRGGSEPGIYVIPAPKPGSPDKVDAARIGIGPGIGSYDWSPDGRWLVYSRRDPTGTSDLWIVPSIGGTPINITRYPGINTSPKWSRDGRRIAFLSNRTGDGSAAGFNIFSIDLLPRPTDDEDGRPPGRRGAPSNLDENDGPLAQRRRGPPPGGGQGPSQGPPPGGGFATRLVPLANNVRIDFDDIHNRAKAVTNTRDFIGNIAIGLDGTTAVFPMTSGGATSWWSADLSSGAVNRIPVTGETGGNVQFSPDGNGFFFSGPGGSILHLSRGAPSPARIAFTASMDVDRRQEIKEAFNEAWRNLRTQFYDPKMHGADWQSLRAKYEAILPEVNAKEDFAWLLQGMIGELNASHTGATPPADPTVTTATAQLGLAFDQNYVGPGLKVASVLPKGPCDQLGKHVEVGDYVLAIDGEDVSFNEKMFIPLRDKVDKEVELTVSNKPSKVSARTLKVKPISRAALDDLDYERWVQTRREKVDALSSGKLAYIHIRAMDQPSLRRFQRELFGDAQSKQGLVLDVRFNGGGRIHDDLLALLVRKPHVFEVPRDSDRSSQPFQVWNRPSILLINEGSASDAEIFPNGFREYGLGKLVGVPTYGGVIGTNNITLIDGTTFRIPRTGWYMLNGKNMENYGVPPDIKVEMTPEDYAEDNDRQLEAAVKELMLQISR